MLMLAAFPHVWLSVGFGIQVTWIHGTKDASGPASVRNIAYAIGAGSLVLILS